MKTLFGLIFLVLLPAGATETPQKAKSTPREISAPCAQPARPGMSRTFYACCPDRSEGPSGWKGTRYAASSDKQANKHAADEAADHNRSHHGHGAIVIAE